MSPRPAAVLRGGDQDLRAHLIATAAAVIARRGTAGLSVREIAKEARVADGVLYNYFDGKDDLIAHGLRAHAYNVLRAGEPAPAAGTGTVEANLVALFTQAVTLLGRIMPAFAGTVGQPAVLRRFRELISEHAGPHMLGFMGGGDGGLPQLFAGYLAAEQKLGRVAADADLEAVTTLLIGAAHDLVLPHVFFGQPGVGDTGHADHTASAERAEPAESAESAAHATNSDKADNVASPHNPFRQLLDGHAERIVRALFLGLRADPK